jgi:outer membrane protein
MFCRVSPGRARRFYAGMLSVCMWLIASDAMAMQRDSLTISEAVNMVLQKSHSLKSLASQLAAAQAKTEGSKTAYYPSVSADLSYANIGPADNLKIQFGGMDLALAPANNYDAHVGAGIVLFDFGKRKLNTDAAQLSEQIIRDKTADAANGIVFQVVSLITTIAMMQQGAAIQNENIGTLERHLNIVKKRVETGTGTDYDVLKTQAQLAFSQAALLDIGNNLAKLRITFSSLMGAPADSLPSIKTNLDSTHYAGNIDSLVSIALTQRTEIITQRTTVETLKIRKELIEKEMVPVLDAAVSTGVKDGYPSMNPSDINALKFNWVASARVHVPLYDGSRERYHLKEVQADLDAANEVLADMVEKVRAEVLSAFSDVTTAYLKLASSAMQVKLGEESLRLAQKSLEAGTLTNDDVLNTEKDYSQAKLVDLQDHIRYMLSLYSLKQATGVSLVKEHPY